MKYPLLLFVVFLVFLLKSGLAQVLDSEYDYYDTWLQKNTVIMRKVLPSVNSTWKSYYQSWGLDYDREMAKRELSIGSAEYIDSALIGTNLETTFNVTFDVQLIKCSAGHVGFRNFTVNEDFSLIVPLLKWNADYCGSKTIQKFCDTGDRLKILMMGNSTISNGYEFHANVTFTCPYSFYYAFLDTFRRENLKVKKRWEFTMTFYIIMGSIAAVSLLAVGLVLFLLFEKRNRKISRMADGEEFKRFQSVSDYHSFDIVDFDLPTTSSEELNSEQHSMHELIPEDGFVPIRK